MRSLNRLLLLVSTTMVAGLGAGSVAAQDCEFTISGNDMIQFDKSEISVPADCDEVTLTLEHTGELQVEQMGHNWVLTESSVWQEVAQAGQNAGLDNDHVPQGDDRIITYTEMIGGGESTSITFDVSDLERGGDYTYFCSFPGHWAAMNGEFILES